MRELHCENFHYTLYRDEADGGLYLEAICNRSAFYFTVAARLLPSEAKGLFKAGTTVLTAAGLKRLARIADSMQWSQEKFSAARREAWLRLGYPGEPAVPPLKAG
jgi:hypothetical protein